MTRSMVIIFLLALMAPQVQGQDFVQKDYYIFPIKPGQRNYLSGSMGELRSNHFHAGLDIKTGGQTGWPVYAAASGYVYRVKVSSYGYGRVLYMQHPNGQRTVYAHLQRFAPELEKWVLEQQYALETFEIELFPEPGQFSFGQGNEIAKAGNTGSSAGPHLHFEIRDSNDVALNPLLFGFGEVQDNIAPVVNRLALKAMDKNARVDGRFGRQEVNVYRTAGNVYRSGNKVAACGWVALEFQGTDRANGTSNTYGVNRVVVELNGQEVYSHNIEQVPFETTRFINVFKDYGTWLQTRKTFQRCYREDGNQLPFYEDGGNQGWFYIPEGTENQVKLRLYDSYGNQSQVLLAVQGDCSAQTTTSATLEPGYEVRDNLLLLRSENSLAEVFTGIFKQQLLPAWQEGRTNVFMWDLRQGLPDSVHLGDLQVKNPVKTVLYPGYSYIWHDTLLTVEVPAGALHDTLYLSYSTLDNTYLLGNASIPLFRSVNVTIRPDNTFKDSTRVGARRIDGRRRDYLGGIWNNGFFTFSTSAFGKFTLAEDKEPPFIVPLSISPRQVRFRIDDRESGLDSFRATLNGKWILMYYDHRKDQIWSVLPDGMQFLKGNFRLAVTDRQGNQKIYTRKL